MSRHVFWLIFLASCAHVQPTPVAVETEVNVEATEPLQAKETGWRAIEQRGVLRVLVHRGAAQLPRAG